MEPQPFTTSVGTSARREHRIPSAARRRIRGAEHRSPNRGVGATPHAPQAGSRPGCPGHADGGMSTAMSRRWRPAEGRTARHVKSTRLLTVGEPACPAFPVGVVPGACRLVTPQRDGRDAPSVSPGDSPQRVP